MIKKILIAFIFLTSSIVLGQRTTSSPYSFFGIGEEFSATTIEQASMGGIGVATNSRVNLNFTNPAAYSNLGFTTYTFGVLSKDLNVKTDVANQSVNSTSLSYFALGFPIGKKAGFSIGMQPLSSVGYSLTNTSSDSATNLSGSGGINRLYGSFGIKVYKELSLGLEVDFNFGKKENTVTNKLLNVALGTRYNQRSTVRGGTFKLGAQYSKILKNKLILDLGSTFRLGSNLDVNGSERLYSLTVSDSGSELIRDELATTKIQGTYNLPLQTIFGVGLGKFNKWNASIEYENTNAIGTTGLLDLTGDSFKYTASNRLSVGGFYTPNAGSLSSYWERVTYRAGFRFENTGLSIDGAGTGANYTKVNDFGMSFGIGLPLGRRLSKINLGFEYGKKGTLIQENYFNFRIGLNLNASGRNAWFQKRRID